MRRRIPFNYEWLYKEAFEEGDTACTDCREGFALVDLPHTGRMLPFNYINEEEYQFVSCYKKEFRLGKDTAGQRVFLQFDGVMAAARVYCNGELAGSHKGGYTPFRIELTPFVRRDRSNVVTVRVDSTEDPEIPPFGNVLDYLTYGGIYREVWLLLTEQTVIGRVRLTCPDTRAAVRELECCLDLDSSVGGEAQLAVTLEDRHGQRVPRNRVTRNIMLKPGSNLCRIVLKELAEVRLWDIEEPVLYDVEAVVRQAGREDTVRERFGFRECSFEPDGFYLNGKKRKLIGLNRHQSFPYTGYAMPARIQKKDAEILKETGINVVRCSHYPQSPYFLERCDELGLLVIEELPGWQHIGGEAWKEQAFTDIRDMIHRDYNHPSIILWGVRINESMDDHDFYVRTNALAHEEDPVRQTGGIRYIRGSELLEDVYTYNDFTYDGGEKVLLSRQESMGTDKKVPVLVTESMGHMYPAKQFDQEERRVGHALRHLRVMDETIRRKDLAGEISWCAFDYNTHGCFGSGDKVCYHGIFDMFRNPKYAAFAYASQKEPSAGVVMEPLTLGARGEKDGGGLVPFYVCTNCDFVRVYRNGALVDDFYPDADSFGHLPHPPVRIGHLIEKNVDFGIPGKEGEDFVSFLKERLLEGRLLKLEQKEMFYIAGLAGRYGLDPGKLYGRMVRMAGGWGDRENNLLLEGWLQGEKKIERRIGENKSMAGILAVADDTVLYCGGDTYDATRIVLRAVDTLGETEPFTQECVQIRLEGPARLMGPDRFPLQGGMGAFWIRTAGRPGQVRIRAEGVYQTAECRIEVRELGPENGA